MFAITHIVKKETSFPLTTLVINVTLCPDLLFLFIFFLFNPIQLRWKPSVLTTVPEILFRAIVLFASTSWCEPSIN